MEYVTIKTNASNLLTC